MVPQTVVVSNGSIAPTAANGINSPVTAALRASTTPNRATSQPVTDAGKMDASKPDRAVIDELLERQRRAPLPVLYGQKTGISPAGRELIRAGVSEVIDQGGTVVVLFSAVNTQDHAVELMPPQIQLGGMKKTGKIIRRSRWSIAEQLPVTDFRMSRRRLGPGERADGVVVFERPSFKQSNETLFLQLR